MGECYLSIVLCGKIVSIGVVKIYRMTYFVGIRGGYRISERVGPGNC